MLKDLRFLAENGATYVLFGSTSKFHTVFLDGTGIPNIRRITERTPLQHGATDRGFRFDPRQMTLTIMLEGLSEADTDALRDTLAVLFAPTNDPLTLMVTRDDGAERHIDCYVDGLVDFPQSTRTGAGQRVIVPLIAPDPFWYHPTQQTETETSATSPIQINVFLGDYTWDDWPVIDITGPTGADTQLQVYISGSADDDLVALIEIQDAIPDDEVWRLDFRPGFKTFKKVSDNTNKMASLLPGDLPAFLSTRIYSSKNAKAVRSDALATGFALVGTGYDAGTTLAISWYKRYLSL